MGNCTFTFAYEDVSTRYVKNQITADTSFEDSVADLKAFAREQLEGAFAPRSAYAFA